MPTENPIEMNTERPGPHPTPAMDSNQDTTQTTNPPESSPAPENRVIPAAERLFYLSSASVDKYAVGGLHLTLAILDSFDAGRTAAGAVPAGAQPFLRRYLCGSPRPFPVYLQERETEKCMDELRALGPELFARVDKLRKPWGATLKVRFPPRRQPPERPPVSRAPKIITVGPVAARRMELWQELRAVEMRCRDGGHARVDDGMLTAHVWAAVQVAPVGALEILLSALRKECMLWEELDAILANCDYFLPYLVRSCELLRPFLFL